MVELFPALTGLDLSGKADTLDVVSCTFPHLLPVSVAGIPCMLPLVCPQSANFQCRQFADTRGNKHDTLWHTDCTSLAATRPAVCFKQAYDSASVNALSCLSGMH